MKNKTDAQARSGVADQPAENLTDHNYDGIQEIDNPTPGWWTYIFVGTILWAFVYMVTIWMTSGALSAEAFYERDFAESLKLQYGELGDIKPDAETLVKLSKDEKWLRVGASLYSLKCIACHGTDGSGMTGPNLTDDHYLNVKTIEDIADVVANGRKNGAMPAWRNELLPVEQVLVSSYVASLRGKQLPSVGNRGPEGEIIPPWPQAK
ncbi:MAG TPA: cbb3-type cytochrome c oxidase N-terminal domain-containing protein [Tepidisphaeraceae bacterium]|nr:cbb3-type cytochrome c oxidase N-terminal domain-containing protein [Tepidisphaeraceae bacterium]